MTWFIDVFFFIWSDVANCLNIFFIEQKEIYCDELALKDQNIELCDSYKCIL